MKHIFAVILMLFAVSATAYAGEREESTRAYDSALAWLHIWDAGNYDESRNEASTYFKNDVSRIDAKRTFEELRLSLGAIKARRINSSEFNQAPDGDYWHFVFESDFENRNPATETVEMVRESDGAWKVSSWLIR